MAACNTAQRLGMAERKNRSSIRLPFKSEQKDTATFKVPQFVTYEDGTGNKNIIMTAERDSVSGNYELMGGQLGEITVTAAAKSVAERNGKITLDFVVTVPENLMMKDWRMVINPKLDNGGDIMMLDSLEITGVENYNFNLRRQRQLNRELNNVRRSENALLRRQQWAEFRRTGKKSKESVDVYGTQVGGQGAINASADLSGKGMRLDTVMVKGNDYVYFYSQTLQSGGLATRLKVWFDSYIVNCGDDVYPLESSDTVGFNISSFLQFMDRAPRYVRKTVYRKVTDKMTAQIQFRVGDNAVIDTLADNRSELQKVRMKLKELAESNEFVIDSLYITAFASPEGAWSLNAELARKRGASIRDCLMDMDSYNVLPESECIIADAEAEDWRRLRSLIMASPYVTHAEQIANIIDTQKEADMRETQIRTAFPVDYQYIREQLYPQLRAVDFTFCLARRNMVEDVMFTDEIDTRYAEAVELMLQRKYKEAMPKLLEYRDMNTALCYMSLGYNKTAIKILDEQPLSADREYLKAILYAREGDIEKAVQLYMKSCEMDASKIMRGTLDPEIADIIKAYNLHADEF
ncbi:MAG: hypothetical protein IJZ44_06180 [Lachnospiraceae bacterium]|nr:hypothetical protein [Lachnospiraceae bacterium]